METTTSELTNSPEPDTQSPTLKCTTVSGKTNRELRLLNSLGLSIKTAKLPLTNSLSELATLADSVELPLKSGLLLVLPMHLKFK